MSDPSATQPLYDATQPTTAAKADAVTLRDALSAKYSLPHHILLWEVRNCTGFDSTRSADAMAITLYVSRGHAVTGFEIKQSRSDWLAELKRPEKAEAIAQFCDFFFLVTSSPEIAKMEEVPMPWGWLALKGKRLKVMKQAERLQSVPLDRPMLCSLIYSTMKRFEAETRAMLDSRVKEHVEKEHKNLTYRAESAERQYLELKKQVEEFENASGLYFRWQSQPIAKMGDAVRRLLAGESKAKEYERDLVSLHSHALRIANNLERELDSIRSEMEKIGGKSA